MRNDKIRRFRPRTNKYRSRRPNNGVQSNGIVHHVHNPRNGLSRNNKHKRNGRFIYHLNSFIVYAQYKRY